MKMTRPDTRGMTNGEYRKARGTDKPFKYDPSAWAKLRDEARMAKLREMDQPTESARPVKAKKARKPRKVKERKKVDSRGRVRVCSTERKRKGR